MFVELKMHHNCPQKTLDYQKMSTIQKEENIYNRDHSKPCKKRAKQNPEELAMGNQILCYDSLAENDEQNHISVPDN